VPERSLSERRYLRCLFRFTFFSRFRAFSFFFGSLV
jgi:hypothetical protein